MADRWTQTVRIDLESLRSHLLDMFGTARWAGCASYAAVDEHLAEKCEEGMALVRELQAQVKRVKFGNRIRRSVKLPVR